MKPYVGYGSKDFFFLIFFLFLFYISYSGLVPPKEPCIVELANFCANNFNWKDPELLRKKFDLWEGVFLQMLYSLMVYSFIYVQILIYFYLEKYKQLNYQPWALYDPSRNLLCTQTQNPE